MFDELKVEVCGPFEDLLEDAITAERLDELVEAFDSRKELLRFGLFPGPLDLVEDSFGTVYQHQFALVVGEKVLCNQLDSADDIIDGLKVVGIAVYSDAVGLWSCECWVIK